MLLNKPCPLKVHFLFFLDFWTVLDSCSAVSSRARVLVVALQQHACRAMQNTFPWMSCTTENKGLFYKDYISQACFSDFFRLEESTSSFTGTEEFLRSTNSWSESCWGSCSVRSSLAWLGTLLRAVGREQAVTSLGGLLLARPLPSSPVQTRWAWSHRSAWALLAIH